MKRMMLVMAFILSLLLCNFYGVFDHAVAQQGQGGRLIFLCGQTSQQVMDQMAPLVPKITKDQYNFIYLSYSLTGNVAIIFQFYQDRLQGLLVGETAPTIQERIPDRIPDKKVPYKIR